MIDSQERFVIRKVGENFQVFAARTPGQRFIVSGGPTSPACDCPEFQESPEMTCSHIHAVHGGPARGAAENGRGAHPREQAAAEERGTGSRMILKRSVSPDGRIDSLSVEIAAPVSSPGEVPAQAARTLGLQDEIVARFLEGRSGQRTSHVGQADGREQPSDGQAVDAELLNIGGINTRYGRRLFLNVRTNGRVLKLFGSEKKLAEAIHSAGFPEAAEWIEEGIQLNLPCRVTTQPTEDGRYVNVETVLPANGRP